MVSDIGMIVYLEISVKGINIVNLKIIQNRHIEIFSYWGDSTF